MTTACDPRHTPTPGSTRRAVETDVFHCGSRSGVATNSKTSVAEALIKTLALRLSGTHMAPASGADEESTLDLKSAMMRSLSTWSISSM